MQSVEYIETTVAVVFEVVPDDAQLFCHSARATYRRYGLIPSKLYYCQVVLCRQAWSTAGIVLDSSQVGELQPTKPVGQTHEQTRQDKLFWVIC